VRKRSHFRLSTGNPYDTSAGGAMMSLRETCSGYGVVGFRLVLDQDQGAVSRGSSWDAKPVDAAVTHCGFRIAWERT
jgi:hypothetical protein